LARDGVTLRIDMESKMRRKTQVSVPTVRTSSNRKIFDFRQTKFWAERGLIHTVHEETGEYTTCSVREWLERAQALSNQAWHEKYADEREQIVTLVENMVKVAKQAKGQGDPHTRDGVTEAVRRLPTQISLPEVVYSFRGRERRVAAEAQANSPLVLPGDKDFK
jgi:hypothetical protein